MLLICNLRSFSRPIISKHFQMRNVHYIQGQEPEPKIREYFYFIDHQGMVSNLCTLMNKYSQRHNLVNVVN